MNRPFIYITRKIPDCGIEILKKEFAVKINKRDRKLKKNEIVKEAKGAVGLVTLLGDTVDRELLENLPHLKAVANYAVGYNNIDIKEATERGIVVSNTPDVLTETTADLTWGLILAAARRIVDTDKKLREGKFTGWAPELFLGRDVYAKTLGIIGMGRIGKAVAERATGFQMNIIYNKRNRLSRKDEKNLNINYKSLRELIKESDYISINAPLNDSTYHLFSKKEFEMMKEDALIINTGRGAIIDEKALVRTLKKGEIAGAGLDVYENEPKVEPELVELDNVVLTPHIGSATYKTRDKMAELAARGLIAGIKGRSASNIVNPEVID